MDVVRGERRGRGAVDEGGLGRRGGEAEGVVKEVRKGEPERVRMGRGKGERGRG